MEQLVAAVFAFLSSMTDVPAAEALVSTANDTHLTVPTAMEHVAAAQFAGTMTNVDPDLLLAIAHHESRYEPNVIGPLVRGKHACGVMQHVPVTGPCPRWHSSPTISPAQSTSRSGSAYSTATSSVRW